MADSEINYTTFPDRPACFGDGSSNTTCSTATPSMIDFLNITDAETYKQVYCLNPPSDSCAFGYCANPDIASLAVRLSTYTGTVCLAILILYSPDNMIQSFYAQLLQIYSLMLAAIVSIGLRQLTRLHAVFALTAAGSPLSLYLLTTAIRSIFTTRELRLDTIFGKKYGRKAFFNRVAVILGLPSWATILAFIARPSGSGWFQQTACDALFKHSLVSRFFYGPVFLLLQRSLRSRLLILTPFGVLVIAWMIALILQYKGISRKTEVCAIRRAWRVVTDAYPFIRFCTLILFPFALWLSMLESGALFSNEHFTPTYGQILAIAAAIPPLVQCLGLLPRLRLWFINLTWFRFITGRRRREDGAERFIEDTTDISAAMYWNGSLQSTPWNYSTLDKAMVESMDIGVRPEINHAHTSSTSSAATDSTVVSLYDSVGDKLYRDYSACPTPLAAAFSPHPRHSSVVTPSNNYITFPGGNKAPASSHDSLSGEHAEMVEIKTMDPSGKS